MSVWDWKGARGRRPPLLTNKQTRAAASARARERTARCLWGAACLQELPTVRGTDFNYFEAHGGWGHMVRPVRPAALSAACRVSQRAVWCRARAARNAQRCAAPRSRGLRGRLAESVRVQPRFRPRWALSGEDADV
jgi:hypothetical protein